MATNDDHSQVGFHDTQSNLLKEIRDNHAAQMAAQQASIEANNRKAEECQKLRLVEEQRMSEERLRRDSYLKLMDKLDFFKSQSELILEVLRMVSARLLRIQPPDNDDERRIFDKLTKKLTDETELMKMDKLHELEKSLIGETDAAKKFQLREQIRELRDL
jgi:hypothetical protein